MLCLFASCVFVSNSIQTPTPLFKIVQFWSSQVVVSFGTSLNLELKSRWQANLSIDLRNPSMKRHHFIQTQRTSFCFQLLISKPLITGTELLDKCHWKVCSQQETIAIYISSRHCLEKHQRALYFFFFYSKSRPVILGENRVMQWLETLQKVLRFCVSLCLIDVLVYTRHLTDSL